MLKSTYLRGSARARLTLCGTLLVFPALLQGQGLARDALSNFSDDTQQLAYTNLADLRGLPAYPQIRQRLLNRQFRGLVAFLRSMGMDPERDVDEVVLGWRGAPSDTANFFGVAAGRFQPDQAHDFFAQKQLPSRHYGGAELYAFGSGREAADLFFTFLSSSLAAFGHLNDLAALLDARSGARPALDSNSSLVGWEAELEGSSPQWGIMAGKAAANMAAPWLTGGAKLPVDPSAVLAPVQAVLYRVDWSGSGFSARFSILCQSAESAAALGQLLALWRDYQRGTASGAPSNSSLPVSSLDVETEGSRVELSASGPVEALDQLLPP